MICRLGQIGGVINLLHRAVGESDAIDDARVSRDDVHAVFAAQALLDNLQMQQAEEPAAEAKPQCHRRFGLVHKRRVVQLQLGQVGLEMFVVSGVNRVDPAEHHGWISLKPGSAGDGWRASVIVSPIFTSRGLLILAVM